MVQEGHKIPLKTSMKEEMKTQFRLIPFDEFYDSTRCPLYFGDFMTHVEPLQGPSCKMISHVLQDTTWDDHTEYMFQSNITQNYYIKFTALNQWN